MTSPARETYLLALWVPWRPVSHINSPRPKSTLSNEHDHLHIHEGNIRWYLHTT